MIPSSLFTTAAPLPFRRECIRNELFIGARTMPSSSLSHRHSSLRYSRPSGRETEDGPAEWGNKTESVVNSLTDKHF